MAQLEMRSDSPTDVVTYNNLSARNHVDSVPQESTVTNNLLNIRLQQGEADVKTDDCQLGGEFRVQQVDSTSDSDGKVQECVAPSSPSRADKDPPKSPNKSKRKEDKAIDHILRALSSLHTTEEKLAALCKKYAELLDEHRQVQNILKQQQRKISLSAREKDQIQCEHNKALMAKNKLESLCRELQKQNKLIKEESLLRARDDEERRKEVHAKFQSTIGEIQTQMSDNHNNHLRLKQENLDLSEKLRKILERCEAQEQHIKKVMQQRELESQLHEVKLQQAQMRLQEEREGNKMQREQLLHRTQEAHKMKELHETQEKQLRLQLDMYTEKYEDFQSTLNKSNEVFGKFKSEMDKMAKRIKKLEKETLMWRGKWETSQKALIEMTEDKHHYENDRLVMKTKNERLESLCRALQAERNVKKSNDAVDRPDNMESVATDASSESTTPPNSAPGSNLEIEREDDEAAAKTLTQEIHGLTEELQDLKVETDVLEKVNTSTVELETPQGEADSEDVCWKQETQEYQADL